MQSTNIISSASRILHFTVVSNYMEQNFIKIVNELISEVYTHKFKVVHNHGSTLWK